MKKKSKSYEIQNQTKRLESFQNLNIDLNFTGGKQFREKSCKSININLFGKFWKTDEKILKK